MEDAVEEINTLAKAIQELLVRGGETGMDFTPAITAIAERIELLCDPEKQKPAEAG